LLPVLEDERRIFIAAENPHVVSDVLREFQFVSGKTLVAHVALKVTISRMVRAAYAARARGESLLAGPDADVDTTSELGAMVVVSDVDSFAEEPPIAAAQEAVLEDVTKEIVDADLIAIELVDPTGIDIEFRTEDGDTPIGDPGTDRDTSRDLAAEIGLELSTDTGASSTERMTTQTPLSQIELLPDSGPREMIDLDDGPADDQTAGGPPRILIVDDDFATRHLLVKELQPLGLATVTASSGGEAVRLIKHSPPSLVVLDVMLPEIDGFQICRAIKQSRRYNDIPVILMSAVIDSGRVTDDVLRRYGADAYFEKPLNTDRIKRRIRDLLAQISGAHSRDEDDSFERALDLYRSGDIGSAVDALRKGLQVDPLSAKHHFVLANLLQKQALIYEAIDEYEATVDLKPDYFPALTRLAYLYYKQGFSAKAIEAWRRSLPHCPDVNLRQNIEVFMRKLIADMQSEL
jgi:DNA-binding response OmpR family regulator